MKILSWNVNGIRAIHKKGFLEWILKESPDVLCLQEVKAEEEQIPKDLQEIPGYFLYVNSAQKKGYSGTAIYTKIKPETVEKNIGLKQFDEEGRLVFSNIKKAVGYALSNSFVEIAFIFGGVLLNFPTPLTIAQILWMHLICDGPPDMMLAFEPKEKSLLTVPPKKIIREKIFGEHIKFLVFAISFMVGALALFLFWYFWRGQEANLSLARTIAFITIAAVDLIYIFSYKNLSKPINKMENFFQNKYLFLGVAYGFVLLVLAVYVPFLNKILGTVPLRLSYWIPAILVALATTAMIEVVKIIYNRIQEKREIK